ncbi:MAG: hypothetical protein EOO73_32095 [Myxococcales bacterium]|nr:MAG: hypothetical protein EOO73_32095 [Myxococcales bacterium]
MESAFRQTVAPQSSPLGTIREVHLKSGSSPLEQRLALYASSCLQRQLRCERIRVAPKGRLPELTIALAHWQHERANVTAFDRLLDKVAADGDFRLVLWSRDWLDGVQPAQELLNRYQRFLPLPLDYRPLPRLAEVLSSRRLLTSSRDGVDVWRWLLRSSVHPPRALEIAALFHDALLPIHGNGARVVWSSLTCLGFARAELVEATELASRSELGESSTPELALLRDARDLCFFSSKSWQFSREHSRAETLAAVKLRLRRMSERAVCLALGTRQPTEVSAMMEEVLDDEEHAPDSGVRLA